MFLVNDWELDEIIVPLPGIQRFAFRVHSRRDDGLGAIHVMDHGLCAKMFGIQLCHQFLQRAIADIAQEY